MLRECLLLIVTTEEWTMKKTTKSPGERIVKDIKRATRKHYSSEEKIRIVLDGLRGEDSIAELCRREGISQGIYYKWSKDFMEAGKKRLAGDTARAANTDEVKELRREAKDLKEVVAEQTLELRLLKKSMYDGDRAKGNDRSRDRRNCLEVSRNRFWPTVGGRSNSPVPRQSP